MSAASPLSPGSSGKWSAVDFWWKCLETPLPLYTLFGAPVNFSGRHFQGFGPFLSLLLLTPSPDTCSYEVIDLSALDSSDLYTFRDVVGLVCFFFTPSCSPPNFPPLVPSGIKTRAGFVPYISFSLRSSCLYSCVRLPHQNVPACYFWRHVACFHVRMFIFPPPCFLSLFDLALPTRSFL